MSDSSDEEVCLTPTELTETVNNAQMSFLPQQSREKYLKQYDMFNTWRLAKGAKTFSENVLLAYFIELSENKKASTLWSTYSMLKATIKMKKDIHIDTYPKLVAFLKRAPSGHQPKKLKVFTVSDIEKFLNEAPDSVYLAAKIGPLTDSRWHLGGARDQEASKIAIQVTPPDGEEDDEFVPTLRMRRKLSTPLSALPGITDGLINLPNLRVSPTRALSPLDRTKRRFSTMVSSAAAAAVSRRLSATIGWCLASPTQVKPQIVRQGRALCLQYIKTQIRRSTLCAKKQIVMKRLQRMLETECGEEAVTNTESGVFAGLRALCAALERKRPNAFRHVARQATRAPSAMLRSDTALAELALALARRITRENITWSKIAAVYCVCGALAREAAEAADGEPALELVSAPAAAIADLLHEEPGSWVASHGGWNGLVERLRASERDQRSEKNLRVMISFFVFACFTLLLFRWVLHAHPAYNE